MSASDKELVSWGTLEHQLNIRTIDRLSSWVADLAASADPDIIAGKAELAVDTLAHYSGPVETTEINEEYSWTDSIAMALLTGWPLVSIEPFSPYAENYPNGFSSSADLLPKDQSGIAIWKMFLALKQVFPHIGLVSMLDDYNGVSAEEGQSFIANIIRLMHQEGAIIDNEHPGEDYVLIPESRMAQRALETWKRFYQAQGEVVENGDEIRFVPSAEKIKSMHLHSKNRRKELKRQGVLLLKDGKPSCPLMDCLSYAEGFNYHILHWNILPESFRQQQDQAYTLLRSLDMVPQENYQNIYFPDDQDEEVLLRSLSGKIVASLKKASGLIYNKNNHSAFFPEQAGSEHFAKVNEHDQEAISLALDFLKEQKTDVSLVCDISSRGNMYPLFIWQHFMKDGEIFLEQKSLATRLWMSSQLEAPAEYWQEYHNLIGSNTRDTSSGELRVDITYNADADDDFKKNTSLDGISGFLAFDFLGHSRLSLQGAVRSSIQRLRPGGVFIFTHLVPQDMTVEALEEIYRDQDTEYQLKEIAPHPLTPEQKAIFVSGYTKTKRDSKKDL